MYGWIHVGPNGRHAPDSLLLSQMSPPKLRKEVADLAIHQVFSAAKQYETFG